MARTGRHTLIAVLVPIAAILIGGAVASLLIALTGVAPSRAFGALFSGGFGFSGRVWPIFITLSQSTPLILTGLAAMTSFRVGLFCIAQEAQYVFGAITAAWLGAFLSVPPALHIPVMIVTAVVAGGIFGIIPAFLKVKLGVNEIISSIMLNEIAKIALEYLVAFPLRADAGQKAQSPVIPREIWFGELIPGSRLGVEFFLALLVALFVYFFIWRTPPGYELRMVGQAKEFARYGGIKSDAVIIRTLFISGGIAGLAGSFQVLGNFHRIMTGFSSGLGFDGLAVALLGQAHPLGVAIVAILLAGIRLGARLELQISLQIPRELGGTMIALIILSYASANLYKPAIDRVVRLVDRTSSGGQDRFGRPPGSAEHVPPPPAAEATPLKNSEKSGFGGGN